MKQLLTFVVLVFSVVATAQAPALINYQGVARDASGNPVVSQNISIKFDIRRGGPSGQLVHSEPQGSVPTNSLGLFNTQIGLVSGLDTITVFNGGLYLEVSMDITGSSNYVSMGTQNLVSVPYALHAKSVPASISGNVLTIGTKTMALAANGLSLTPSGIITVTNNGNGNFIIDAPTPTITGQGSATVSGTYPNLVVNVPTSASPTVQGTGLAAVTSPTSNSFNVDVPVPTYNANSGALSFGNNSLSVVPALSLVSGVLRSGPFSNTVIIPNAVTVTQGATGIAQVIGGPNYTITVPAPTLGLSANNQSLGISGGNTIALPTSFPQGTLTGTGFAQVSSLGINSFVVNAPLPTYNSLTGVLSFGGGTNNVTVLPTLSLSSSAMFLGNISNSVSLSGIGPWRQATGAVTLATASDKVGIGTNAPAFPLDVQGTTGILGSVYNSGTANTNPAFRVTSDGSKALSAVNNNASGVAGEFVGNGGYAIFASNNSLFYTFQATNSNTNLSAYAGYFDGGFIAQAKNNPSASNLILSARNASATDVFVVRNDGLVGIGTGAPSGKLDVQSTNGFFRVYDITSGPNNSILMTHIMGLNTYAPQQRFSINGSSNFVDIGQAANDDFVIEGNDVVRFVMTNGGNVGINTAAPTQKLDVTGSIKMSDGNQADGKVMVSDGTGVSAWKKSPSPVVFGGLNNSGVNLSTSPTALGTPAMSFTKVFANTTIEVNVMSRISTGSFSGASTVYFEVYIDNTAGASGIFVSNSQNTSPYVNITAYFTGLSAGSHTVTIVGYTDAGTSTGITADPGGYNGRVIVKEQF